MVNRIAKYPINTIINNQLDIVLNYGGKVELIYGICRQHIHIKKGMTMRIPFKIYDYRLGFSLFYFIDMAWTRATQHIFS